MLVFYRDDKLKKEFETDRILRRQRGRDQAEKIKTRLAEIEVALHLEELELLPGRHHPLQADKHGWWGCGLNGNYRLIYEPWPPPLQTLPDGGLNKQAVTGILIHGVLDYHERKNKKPR